MNKLEERIIEELLDTIKRLKSDISVINEAYCELQDEYEALELENKSLDGDIEQWREDYFELKDKYDELFIYYNELDELMHEECMNEE